MTTDAPAGAILLYGAYGYTGELIARLAVSRGESLILAGRDSLTAWRSRLPPPSARPWGWAHSLVRPRGRTDETVRF